MRLVEPKVEVMNFDPDRMMRELEWIGRHAYKREKAVTDHSYSGWLRDKVERGHYSILEHRNITCIFTVDRGVSHELVRHRLAAITQESTRYCNYSKIGDGNVAFIRPFYLVPDSAPYKDWLHSCTLAEWTYLRMLESGSTPQEARAVLPNSLKTEVVFTANIREWQHIFTLRAQNDAHPQMQQVMIPLLLLFRSMMPPLFDTIVYNRLFDQSNYAKLELID